MFIAMNRFKVKLGSEADFEQVWRERDSHLSTVPGFKQFELLRGPQRDDHTLYASHTIWGSRADFEAWTKSEAIGMPAATSRSMSVIRRSSCSRLWT